MEIGMLTEVIDRYKSEPESVYNTWFVSSEERMKAFRSIRRGVRGEKRMRTFSVAGNVALFRVCCAGEG